MYTRDKNENDEKDRLFLFLCLFDYEKYTKNI